MQWSVMILLSCVVLGALAVPAPHCTPAAMDGDPRMARVCGALNTFLELYAEASERAPAPDFQAPQALALAHDYPEYLSPGMKRQDVVHNFLRFGRRR